MQPTDHTSRIDTLDYLRGFALLGIILVNIPALMWALNATDTVNIMYSRILILFIEGKFFSIFSFLFGVGFYLFISRAEEKGVNANKLFIRRMLLLLGMGVIHFLFQPGEALSIYAIYGLITLPIYRLRKEILLIIALVIIAGTAFVGAKILMPLGFILLGITVGKYRIFERIDQHKKQWILFTVVMLVISIIGLLYQWSYVPEGNPQFELMTDEQADIHRTNVIQFHLIGYQISPFVTGFWIGLFTLLIRIRFFRIILAPLKYYGRMALTNYLGQTFFIFIAAYLLGLHGQVTLIETLWICLIIYAIQLIFSYYWMKFFRFGPLEWLWRYGTYGEAPAIYQKKD